MDFCVSTKVGRAFNIENRRTNLRRISGVVDKPEVLQSYTATHQVVFDTEQEIHAELRQRGFQHDCDWTNECFTKACWETLQELLEGFVREGVLERLT